MIILVANPGSTSFKYRLYDLSGGSERLLARGAVERIGSQDAKVSIRSPRGDFDRVEPIADHQRGVKFSLAQGIPKERWLRFSRDARLGVGGCTQCGDN